MNKKVWMIDGIMSLRSKGGTGNRKMISSFKSRVFGFGLEMSEEKPEEVNSKRCRQQTHSSCATDVAKLLYGLAQKKVFTELLFVQMIDYGNAKNGY
jgi:hypothetical protein